MAAPIVLVPGFWLGAWAWDEVADRLRRGGHDVTAITLPGLEPDHVDPGGVTLADHVAAIVDAVEQAAAPVVLAVHSGAGVPAYEVTDRVPERIARAVYVDSAPATGPLDADFEGDVWPLPTWQELEDDGSSLEGLTDHQLERFRDRAVPEPAAALTQGPTLADARRLDVPTTVICTAFTSEQVQAAVAEGWAWLGGLAELRDVDWVDLPTSHWPMWSRPDDLADLLADIAAAASSRP